MADEEPVTAGEQAEDEEMGRDHGPTEEREAAAGGDGKEASGEEEKGEREGRCVPVEPYELAWETNAMHGLYIA